MTSALQASLTLLSAVCLRLINMMLCDHFLSLLDCGGAAANMSLKPPSSKVCPGIMGSVLGARFFRHWLEEMPPTSPMYVCQDALELVARGRGANSCCHYNVYRFKCRRCCHPGCHGPILCLGTSSPSEMSCTFGAAMWPISNIAEFSGFDPGRILMFKWVEFPCPCGISRIPAVSKSSGIIFVGRLGVRC